MVAHLVRTIIYEFELVCLLYLETASLREVELGRTGRPVDARWHRAGAIGLHREIIAFGVERLDEWSINLQGRFATRKDDESAVAASLQASGYDVLGAHLPIAGEVGVAKGTPQVASAHADKYGWTAAPSSFALQRIKYLVYSIHRYTVLTSIH